MDEQAVFRYGAVPCMAPIIKNICTAVHWRKEEESVLESVLSETVYTGITMGQFLLCTLASVLLGAALAAVHTYRNRYSRSFIIPWCCCLLWSRQ